MGTFEVLRKRAGLLLAIVIGLAMLSFILGDFLSSGRAFFGGPEEPIVAVIYDTEVKKSEFDERIMNAEEIGKLFRGTDLTPEERDQIKDQEWDNMVRDYIFANTFEELGIIVSKTELNSYISATNPHPLIQQFFTNPETGQFDPQLMSNYLQFMKDEQQDEERKNMQQDAKQRFMYITQQISETKKIDKYFDLVLKGTYVTSLEAKHAADEKNSTVSFRAIRDYVRIDSTDQITVTDDEIKAYFEENKINYQRMYNEAEIEYVAFDIVPSEYDIKQALQDIEKRKDYFSKCLNDRDEVNQYNSPEFAFEGVYYKQGELPYALDTFMFSGKKGDLYGPYLENGSYKLAKISDVRDLPDTVRARHILINEGDQQSTFAKADSLLKLLKEQNADFAQLAQVNSVDDFTKIGGGDLGWFDTKSIPSLAMSLNNDFSGMKQLIDSSFLKNKGEFFLAGSPLGIHIVQVTDKGTEVKKVLPAILVREIIPHNETIEGVYQMANKFASVNNSKEKFDKAAEEQGLQKKYAKLFEQNRVIPQLEEGRHSPREIIRWAFTEANTGSVSGVYLLKDKCVVAKLVSKKMKGQMEMADLNPSELEYGAKIMKKTKQRAQELEGMIAGKSMEEISVMLDSAMIVDVADANFLDLRMQGLPSDPKLFVTAMNLEPNKISKPVISRNTIYIVQTTAKNTAENTTADEQKANLKANVQRIITNNLVKYLEEAANIQDYRIKYY